MIGLGSPRRMVWGSQFVGKPVVYVHIGTQCTTESWRNKPVSQIKVHNYRDCIPIQMSLVAQVLND